MAVMNCLCMTAMELPPWTVQLLFYFYFFASINKRTKCSLAVIQIRTVLVAWSHSVSYLKVAGCWRYRELCLQTPLLNVLLPASQAGNTQNSFSCGGKRKAQELSQFTSVVTPRVLLRKAATGRKS